MNAEIKNLVYDFRPDDPDTTKSDLVAAVKKLQKAVSIKFPATDDGKFVFRSPDARRANRIVRLYFWIRNRNNFFL